VKLFGSSRFLGLAVGERWIQAAQVHVSRDRREVGPMAQFVFPDSLSWDQPAAVGTALRQFLRQHRFSASHAVVGVPARWMLAREKDIPPANAAVAANMLRLQAERDFPPDLDLIFDYAGEPDSSRPGKVLLVAMPRPHLDRITQMADEAGLSLQAVTSSTMALAATADSASALSVVVSPDSAELVLRGQAAPRMLKHLPISVGNGAGNGHRHIGAGSLMLLGSELQRAVALLPPESAQGNRSMFLWDGVGLGDDAASAIAGRSGLEVRIGEDLSALGITSLRGQGDEPRKLGAAVAVAIAASRLECIGVDFLHAKLAPPKKRRVSRAMVLSVLAGVALIAGIIYLYYNVQTKERELNQITQQIEKDKDKVKSAKLLREKVTLARGWFEQRPAYLDCLRDVTMAFPTDTPVYATSLTLRESGKGTINGRAPDSRSASGLQGRLMVNKRFKDVRVVTINQTQAIGGRNREYQFTITFTYHAE